LSPDSRSTPEPDRGCRSASGQEGDRGEDDRLEELGLQGFVWRTGYRFEGAEKVCCHERTGVSVQIASGGVQKRAVIKDGILPRACGGL
jgi:hypothetical protein